MNCGPASTLLGGKKKQPTLNSWFEYILDYWIHNILYIMYIVHRLYIDYWIYSTCIRLLVSIGF